MREENKCCNCTHWRPGINNKTGRVAPKSVSGSCEYPIVWPKNIPSVFSTYCKNPPKTRCWFNDGWRCECFEPKAKAKPQKQEDLGL